MIKFLFATLFSLIVGISKGQWVELISGTTEQLEGVAFINNDTGVVVGSNSTILITTDAGVSWSPVTSPVITGFTYVFFPTDNVGYAIGTDGEVIKTTDAGFTWSDVSTPLNEPLYGIYFNNADTGYVGSYSTSLTGKLFRTTDGGASWAVLSGTYPAIFSMYFQNPDTGFIGGSGPTEAIIKTEDACVNFNAVMPANPNIESFAFFNNSTGLSSTSYGSGNIYKTIDGGDTWTEKYTRTPSNLFDIKISGGNTAFAVGGESWPTGPPLVIKSTDAGDTWVEQTVTSTTYLFDCYFTSLDVGYAVGTNGIILKTTNGGINVGLDEKQDIIDFTIYPNPAKDHITIEADDELIPNARITIYNIVGEVVAQQDLSHSPIVDVYNLAKGSYVLEVVTAKDSHKEKLVIE